MTHRSRWSITSYSWQAHLRGAPLRRVRVPYYFDRLQLPGARCVLRAILRLADLPPPANSGLPVIQRVGQEPFTSIVVPGVGCSVKATCSTRSRPVRIAANLDVELGHLRDRHRLRRQPKPCLLLQAEGA